MKKSFLFVSLSLVALAAGATNNQQYPQYNEYINNNPVVHSSSSALAGAAAFSGSSSAATLTGSGNSTATGLGGAGGTGTGGSVGPISVTGVGGEGVKTSVSVGGTVYERSVPPAIAPNPVSVSKSCRLYISLAGAVASGSGAGGIPIGNDRTCLAPAKLENMNSVERTLNKRVFTDDEFVSVACDVEGMEELQTCKNLKNK